MWSHQTQRRCRVKASTSWQSSLVHSHPRFVPSPTTTSLTTAMDSALRQSELASTPSDTGPCDVLPSSALHDAPTLALDPRSPYAYIGVQFVETETPSGHTPLYTPKLFLLPHHDFRRQAIHRSGPSGGEIILFWTRCLHTDAWPRSHLRLQGEVSC